MNEKELQKTLDYIQSIITRMANNSFQIKKYSILMITIIATLFSNTNIADKTLILSVSSIAPIILLAILDMYYLSLERAYRDLYNNIIKNPSDKSKRYYLGVKPPSLINIINTAKSLSVWLFYITEIIFMIFLLLWNSLK